MATLWPFSRSKTIEKQTPEEVALSISFGGSLSVSEDYQDSSKNPSLSYYADVVSQNSVVFACIREIATSVSSVQYLAVTPTTDGEFAEYYGSLADILRTPNPDQDIVDFIETAVEQLIIFGNVYMWMQRAGSGGSSARINSLYLLRPDLVTVKPGKEAGGIKSYEYQTGAGEEKITIPESDIGHLKYPNTTTGKTTGLLYGLSPLSVIKEDSILDAMLSDLQLNYLKRGAVPAGILKLNKRITSQEDADEVRNRWKSTFSGKKGQWNVAVLDADSSYETLQALPKDLELEGTRDEVVSRICGVLGVPPIIIGAGVGLRRSTYSNYKQAQESYRDETVAPFCNRLVRFFNMFLVPNFSGNAIVQADFKNAAAWQQDEKERSERAISLYDSGIITLNEARTDLGYDTFVKGDIRRAPSNIFEIGASEDPYGIPPPDLSKMIKVETFATPYEKAEEDARFGKIYERIHEKNVEALSEALRKKYFKPIKNRIDGVLGRRLGEPIDYEKEFPFKVEDLIPAAMENELSAVLIRSSEMVIRDVYKEWAESGLVQIATLDSKGAGTEFGKAPAHWSPRLKNIIQAGATQAANIQHTTINAVRGLLGFATENNLSVEAFADGGTIDGKPYKGVRGLIRDADVNRVSTIARTQTAMALAAAQLAYGSDIGVERVVCFDGDQFDEKCIERNGRIFTLEEADQEMLAHPNCQLRFDPYQGRAARSAPLQPVLKETNK